MLSAYRDDAAFGFLHTLSNPITDLTETTNSLSRHFLIFVRTDKDCKALSLGEAFQLNDKGRENFKKDINEFLSTIFSHGVSYKREGVSSTLQSFTVRELFDFSKMISQAYSITIDPLTLPASVLGHYKSEVMRDPRGLGIEAYSSRFQFSETSPEGPVDLLAIIRELPIIPSQKDKLIEAYKDGERSLTLL